jgi:hypothetical protein
MARTKLGGGIVVVALAAACAATSAPTARMQASAAAIRGAEEVGAAHVPQAALHLQLAREESQQAEGLISNGEPERAEGLLLRAEADANLAVAESREDASRQAAANAVAQVKALREASASERRTQ